MYVVILESIYNIRSTQGALKPRSVEARMAVACANL